MNNYEIGELALMFAGIGAFCYLFCYFVLYPIIEYLAEKMVEKK